MARTNTPRRRTGKDSFGQFIMTGGPCDVCGNGGLFTIKYDSGTFDLPQGVEVDHTILQSTDRYIGLNCGCYAKFHRQVTHIHEKMKYKASGPTLHA